MPRVLIALLASLAAVAALAPVGSASASRLPRVHAVDLSGVHGPANLPDPAAAKHIPPDLRAWTRRGAHAADHWTGDPNIAEQRFEDEHGHVLTFATDNPNVDLTPFASLLASTYHYGEIELVHVFVTNTATLEQICGGDAAACYAGDRDRKHFGLMIISYEYEDPAHAVIHEYGHHIDNNTYNLDKLSNCGEDGDGSRRWFFARQMQDNILDRLSCDPEGDWGTLLAEVYAEDYAQMVGIPPEEYHPAISVPRPTSGQKAALRKDLDAPFTPASKKVKGRSSARGTVTFRLRASLPVFLSARSAHGVRGIAVRGCAFSNVADVYRGNCKITVRTKRPGGRFSFKLLIY